MSMTQNATIYGSSALRASMSDKVQALGRAQGGSARALLSMLMLLGFS